MKILLCTNQDIQSNLCLNLLLPKLTDHEVIVYLSPVFKKQHEHPELKKLVYFEKEFIHEILFPHMEASHQQKKFLSFHQLAQKYHVPITINENINAASSLETLNVFQPDLIISIRNSAIFKDPLISIPTHGVLNLHSGLLPQYRGVLATFRALQNRDETIGTTLHYIDDSSIDTGRIIALSHFKTDFSKSLFWHLIHIYDDGIKNVLTAIHALSNNETIPTITQLMSEGSYFSFPTTADITLFEKDNWKMLDDEEYFEFINHYCSIDRSLLENNAVA